MIVTCSFLKNTTAEADCCKYGLKPENLSGFALKQDQAKFCAVDNKLDYLVGCLADHAITVDECRVQTGTTANTKQSKSSATAPTPTRLSMLCVALLGLGMLGGVSAAPASNPTTCKTFTASESNWDLNARTPLAPLYQGGADCRGTSRCTFKAQDEMRPSWKAEWSASPGVDVHADLKAIITKASGSDNKTYAEEVKFPDVPEHEDWAVAGGAVVDLKGQALATRIPGTFSDCDNKQTYAGSVLLPRADEFWYKAVQGPQ